MGLVQQEEMKGARVIEQEARTMTNTKSTQTRKNAAAAADQFYISMFDCFVIMGLALSQLTCDYRSYSSSKCHGKKGTSLGKKDCWASNFGQRLLGIVGALRMICQGAAAGSTVSVVPQKKGFRRLLCLFAHIMTERRILEQKKSSRPRLIRSSHDQPRTYAVGARLAGKLVCAGRPQISQFLQTVKFSFLRGPRNNLQPEIRRDDDATCALAQCNERNNPFILRLESRPQICPTLTPPLRRAVVEEVSPSSLLNR